MAESFSATVDNNALDNKETTIGASPLLRGYNGAVPANADAALGAATLIAVGTLPADFLGAAAARVKSKAGVWTMTGNAAAGAGTALSFYRIYESTGTTSHLQGTIGVNVPLTTNALTAVNGNVLNFAATTGVLVGMKAVGTGILAGSRVIAVAATTVTLSLSSTAGVGSGVAVSFQYDMAVDNASIANTQVATINSFSITVPAST